MTIDPKDLIVKRLYECVKADFGYQYTEYKEEVDNQFSKPLMSEMVSSIIVDSDGYNLTIGKSITRLIRFLASTPVE